MITNYMIIGYGWRADFYYRIAKLLPERFSVCAGVLRTEERAKEVAHKEGVFATSDLDQALERKPDFAVLCVPRDVTKDYLVKLMKKGIPVLCETPPGRNVSEIQWPHSDSRTIFPSALLCWYTGYNKTGISGKCIQHYAVCTSRISCSQCIP